MKNWFRPIIACVIIVAALLATQPARAQISVTYNNMVRAINGTSAILPALVVDNSIAQDAGNIFFAGLSTSVTGNDNFELHAVAAGTGANNTRPGKVDMAVNINPVPEPSILAMTGLGFFSLLMFGRGRKP